MAIDPTTGLDDGMGPAGVQLGPSGAPLTVPLTSNTHTSGGSSRQTIISPAAQSAHHAGQWANAEAADAARTQTDAAVERADAAYQSKVALERQSAEQAAQDAARTKAAEDFYNDKTSAYEKQKQDLSGQKYEGMWANRSNGDKAIAAISLAIGSYLNIKRGFENQPLKILTSAIEDDYKKWQDRYAAQERALVRSGGDATAAQQRFDVLSNAKKASLRQAAIDKGESMVAMTGNKEAQAAGQVLLANLKTQQAKDDQAFYDKTNIEKESHSSNTDVDSTHLVPSGGAGKTGPAMEAGFAANNLSRLRELIEKDPEGVKEWQRALNEQSKADALRGTKLIGDVVGVARGIGGAPVALEQRFKGAHAETAREISSLMAQVETAKARELDPVGAINESVMIEARNKLGLLTRSPQELAKQVGLYEQQARVRASAGGGQRPVATPLIPSQTGSQADAGRPFTYLGKRGTLYANGKFVVDN